MTEKIRISETISYKMTQIIKEFERIDKIIKEIEEEKKKRHKISFQMRTLEAAVNKLIINWNELYSSEDEKIKKDLSERSRQHAKDLKEKAINELCNDENPSDLLLIKRAEEIRKFNSGRESKNLFFMFKKIENYKKIIERGE